ncbi:hypothetical protein L1887_35991 [Cichorium endivia]|nr:hypothetical protein L1887_35991 [Cichorium endivia]
MSTSTASFAYGTILPLQKEHKVASRLKIRAQRFQDEGRSSNSVDSNMKSRWSGAVGFALRRRWSHEPSRREGSEIEDDRDSIDFLGKGGSKAKRRSSRSRRTVIS